MAKFNEVRQVRKCLPYTITSIQDLAVWKHTQAEKEAEWEMKKELKRQIVIRDMENGTIADKQFGKSQATKTHERYANIEQELIRKHIQNIPITASTPQPGVFTMLYNRFTNWLISFKF